MANGFIKRSLPPKNAKTQFSAGKVMTTVFWDVERYLLIECMKKGSTVMGNVYKDMARNLKVVIPEKDPTVILLHNCRIRTTRIV